MRPVPDGPAEPVVQRLRVRYAKRGRMRFASHRDISRAMERAVRRAGIPVAYSGGFTPHPRISYASAAPTAVASEAEYLEIAVSEPCDPRRVRDDLDASLPAGIDVIEVVEARGGNLADRLEASVWEVRLPDADPAAAERAVKEFLTADRVEVERMTKKGMRRFDARQAVLSLTLGNPGNTAGQETVPVCVILRMVVRHDTPAVRPDDVLTGLRLVAGFEPPSPPEVTRLAQGPLDEVTGEPADPFASDRAGSD